MIFFTTSFADFEGHNYKALYFDTPFCKINQEDYLDKFDIACMIAGDWAAFSKVSQSLQEPDCVIHFYKNKVQTVILIYFALTFFPWNKNVWPFNEKFDPVLCQAIQK